MGGSKSGGGGGGSGAEEAEASRRRLDEDRQRWETEQRRVQEQRQAELAAIAQAEAQKKAAEEARIAQEKLEKDNQLAAQKSTGFLDSKTLNSQPVRVGAQANLPAFNSLARRLTAQQKANTPSGGNGQSNSLVSTGVGLGA
jgi:hypothetical protein